ncbi:MAG TPA: hypothetical protein VF771_08750 [Longimicrobiaceae bacterium]
MTRKLAAALALAAAVLAPTRGAGQPLSIVTVGAPAINCVFATSCRVTVTDFTAPLLGGGFLQSRTYQAEPGSPAAGKWVYEYRIDLTRVATGTAPAMVTSLTVDFGPVVGSLDYNGDSRPDQVFVVTSGGLGSVGPSAATQTGRMITFRFAPTVNAGQTSYFFGVVSDQPVRPIRARISTTTIPNIVLEARAPQAGRGQGQGGGQGGQSGPVAPEDCLAYDRPHLTIRDEGAQGWLLTDGVSRMLMLDNRADAERALAVAKAHTHHCFIGRGNHRPNRSQYIVHYWRGNPGASAMPGEDCISYNPATVGVFDRGALGWRLEDGPNLLVLYDNQADANRGLMVARAFSHLCFIGRNNSRPDRYSYIVEYWR